MGRKTNQILDFNIDDHLNRFIPSPRLSRLPAPISHFLGHRSTPAQAAKDPPNLIICLYSFIGALSGLLLVSALYRFAPGLAKYNPPVIIASLGASAILDYNAIRTPLAQPRNAVLGQTFSAIVGVAISKAFQTYLTSSEFEDLQWVAGAVCCATASVVMALTNTVHPPGGATAILAATNAEIIGLGWVYVAFVLLSSVLMLVVALLVNNIQRCYPVYWWTPRDLSKWKRMEEEKQKKEEEGRANEGGDLEKVETNGSREVLRGCELARTGSNDTEAVVVSAGHIYLPPAFDLDDDEVAVLHRLQARLRWDFALEQRVSFSSPG